MNKATKTIVSTFGVIFGISGMNHGLFEALQGDTPTGSFYISAIGDAQRMWPHGSEPAFMLIPNYLWTGIASVMVGLAIVIWALGFVHKQNGPTVLILLFYSASPGWWRCGTNNILPLDLACFNPDQ